MRRQSKPFVTEYRSGNRRAKGGSGSQTSMDGRASESETQRVVWPPSEDDGHNAALAAADALFAGPAKTSSGRSTSTTQSGANGDGGRGRILQAIEEPAPLNLEADEESSEDVAPTLPRRRGRKPGSKRTIVRPTEAEQVDLLAGVRAADEMAFEDLDDSAIEAAAPERPTAPAQVVALPALVPATSLLAASSSRQRRHGERFSWVRTKLRPGERWKRRLPKVAW